MDTPTTQMEVTAEVPEQLTPSRAKKGVTMVKGLFKSIKRRSRGSNADSSPDASMEIEAELPTATPSKAAPEVDSNTPATTPSKAAPEVDSNTPATTPAKVAPEVDSSTPTPEDTRTQTPEDTDTECMPSEKDAEIISNVEDASVTASTPIQSSPVDRFYTARSHMDNVASSIPMLGEAAEQIKVYYVQVKDGVMQIIGNVGNRVVVINAKVCEVGSVPFTKLTEASHSVKTTAKVSFEQARDILNDKTNSVKITAKVSFEQARDILNDKTVWLQDGYIYTTATVEGQVVYVRAKASEFYELLRERTTKLADDVSGKAVAVYDASCTRGTAAVQPLMPYYVKVQNGVVRIVAPIGDKFVVLQAKTSELYATVQVRTLDSLTGARGAIEGYTSPLVSRAVSVRNDVSGRVETFSVSIQDGIVSIRGAVGERIVDFKAKVSEVFASINLKTSDGIMGTKKALTDFTEKMVSIATSGYGKACDRVRLLYVSTNDGFFYIACQFNDRVVVLKMKVSEMDEYMRSTTRMLFSTVADTYNVAKMRVLQATDLTKTKTRQAGANVRSIAANPATQVTVASAAGGAMALGTTGGAAGLGIGGVVGAACAVPAAFFTFGLSIPVGAAIGAGAGLCIGTTAGGATGLVTGGAAGYKAHKHKDQIGSKAEAYRAMAAASTNKLRAQVMGAGGHAVA